MSVCIVCFFMCVCVVCGCVWVWLWVCAMTLQDVLILILRTQEHVMLHRKENEVSVRIQAVSELTF